MARRGGAGQGMATDAIPDYESIMCGYAEALLGRPVLSEADWFSVLNAALNLASWAAERSGVGYDQALAGASFVLGVHTEETHDD